MLYPTPIQNLKGNPVHLLGMSNDDDHFASCIMISMVLTAHLVDSMLALIKGLSQELN